MTNPLTNPYYLMPPIIVAAVLIGLAVLLWRKSRWDSSSRLFVGMLLSFSLWSLLTFLMRSSPDVERALFWEKTLIIGGGLAFLLYYHFTLVYTKTRLKMWALPIIYIVLAALALLATMTDLAFTGMVAVGFGYIPITGPLIAVLYMPLPLLMIGGVYNLAKQYRLSHSAEERNRLLYLATAAIFPMVGVALDTFSDLPPASIWGNLVFCGLCSVAILRYHLLDIYLVFRRTLVYVIVSAIIAIPYISILLLLNQFLKASIQPWWAHVLIIMLIAILLRPLYSWAQRLTDKLFYRDRYDYLQALRKFSQQSQSITDLQDLGRRMVDLVRDALRSHSACLLLQSEYTHGFEVLSCAGLQNLPPQPVLRDKSPFVQWLEHHQGIVSAKYLNVAPQLQYISHIERGNLKQLEAELYVPILTRYGVLSGILALGPKLSEQPYSSEDEKLLMTVCSQMAIALDNAQLYKKTKESENAYRELAESISDIFFAVNEELVVTYWNRASERLTGVSAKDAVGKNLNDLFPNLKITIGAERTYPLAPRIQESQHLITEYQLKGKHSWLEVNTYPSKNGLSVFVRDITEAKRAAEREKQLEIELYRSSRLASVGELAAGIAHEVNNPLTAVIGFSERLLNKSKDEKMRTYLQTVHDEAWRAARVMENLLTFARRREPKKEYANINEIVTKAIELRQYELRTSNIEIAVNLEPALPKVIVDSHQILEVFLNIILNAEQAMSEVSKHGNLNVNTKEIDGYVRICFSDDGPGIQPENLDRLFDPFFTTKVKNGGTGLGLSICHGIISEHGGRLYAGSTPGKGTTFFVELPLTNKEMT